MARIFPLLIIIVLIFIGAIYWSTTFDHVESTTTIANNSSMNTGYTLTMDIAGFASQQWVILAFLAFIVLIGGVFAVMIGGGSD